ncbi:MAG: Rieske (2Fe-2S) protein [Actinomycetota bacterium]|nr:Rieske (2Fe-2S) protein [Actinomycetota bacterium]
MFPFDLIDLLHGAKPLDKVASPVQALIRKAIQPQALRDVLHGVPLGHPVHPPLVQVPLGAWLSAVILDGVPGAEKGADALVGVGVLTALPAAASGLTDWSEMNPQHARVGLVHAMLNSTGLALFVASLAARRSGRRGLGRGLALLGAGQVLVGGVLGGHLSFRQAGGANHASDFGDRAPSDWTALCDFDDLPDGKPVRRMLDDVPVFVYRDGTGAYALGDICSHLSGPLSEGEITGSGRDRCVVCPWHGSTFRFADGSVVHGPATAPQPAFDVRVRDGKLEVRLA